MLRRVAYLAAVAGVVALAAGCALSPFGFERRAEWRDAAEKACMARRPQGYFIRQSEKINGKGACGIARPLKVLALEGGTIGIGPTATIGCPMIETLEIWMRTSVQPAAIAWFGVPIVEIKQVSAYACRTRNNKRGAELSEHAFGNAIDIAGFKLANGREITVVDGWRGKADERSFLREVFASGCKTFKTALGPGAAYHGDHFHFDLAHHGSSGTSRYCKPTLSVTPPARPPYDGAAMAALPGQPRYGVTVPAYAGRVAASPAPITSIEELLQASSPSVR